MIKHSFYKENGIWYIDLPEFIEMGFGTTANLMMVDGSDTFLDFLSNNTDEVTILMSPTKFDGYEYELKGEKQGLNKRLLKLIGHAPVDYGKYYTVTEHNNHRLWLCPVTEYVFGNYGDGYPDNIYIKVV
jgi:hypothetical protein